MNVGSDDFTQGKDALCRGKVQEAVHLLKRAHHANRSVPEVASWYGLAVVSESASNRAGLEMCRRAALDGGNSLELRTNVALAEIACGSRKMGWTQLERLRREAPNDARITVALRRLGIRRPPPLKFLPRQHPLNQTLGRLRSKFLPRTG